MAHVRDSGFLKWKNTRSKNIWTRLESHGYKPLNTEMHNFSPSCHVFSAAEIPHPTVADPGFSRQGGANPQDDGASLLFGKFCSKIRYRYWCRASFRPSKAVFPDFPATAVHTHTVESTSHSHFHCFTLFNLDLYHTLYISSGLFLRYCRSLMRQLTLKKTSYRPLTRLETTSRKSLG